jgi:hypothetical protein
LCKYEAFKENMREVDVYDNGDDDVDEQRESLRRDDLVTTRVENHW